MPLTYDAEDFEDRLYDEEFKNEWHEDLLIGAYVNAYEIQRVYGGPEEGGWWYNIHQPLCSIRVNTKDQARKAFALLQDIWNGYYEDGPDIGSVAHDGDLWIGLENHEARHEPQERPHYE